MASEMRLRDEHGNRLYLDALEREAFLKAASFYPAKERLFAELLHHTGCRISESRQITPARIELSTNRIVFRSLKKRSKIAYREVPVPPDFIERLDLAFNIRQAQKRQNLKDEPLWGWTRQRGFQIIKQIMMKAEIPDGAHRCPKGLRHGFGVNAVVSGVPLNILQKWLGHAQLTTTAIYADAGGREEDEIAARMWG